MIKNFLSKRAYFAIWTGVAASMIFLITQADRDHNEHMALLQKNLYNEAQSHFDNMIITRSWNASHGGVYVKQREGLEPNPYLKDNKLIYDNNKTLIKINPAWMTRQISEIANKEGKYFYKIISLRPLNPSNQPDEFEREALNFFEKNSDKSFYSRFEANNGSANRFNFMGKLSVDKQCMACHADQGYKVGEIRGGIRVSLSTDNYDETRRHLEQKLIYDKVMVTVFSLLIGVMFTLYVLNLNANRALLASLNNKLEAKVARRTRALDKLNSELQERVKEEVAKNKLNEEVMIAQSRHAAMGEMISMLSHQWRQPIAIIEMSVNTILIDIELDDLNMEAFKTELNDIAKETQKLSATISDFSGHFKENAQATKTNPVELLGEVLDIVKSSLENNGVSVEVSASSNHAVFIHQEKLFQVYLTIIGNAKEILVQRNIKNRVIKISVEEDAQYVTTKIRDNAGGIASEHIERVFEPYFTTKDNSEGTGLGLYIAKIIVETQLKGKLTVKNEIDGACFSVRIPK